MANRTSVTGVFTECAERSDLDTMSQVSQVSTRSSQSRQLPIGKSRKRPKKKDSFASTCSSIAELQPPPPKGTWCRIASSLKWLGRSLGHLCSPNRSSYEVILRKSSSEILASPGSFCATPTFRREISARSYANRFIQFSLEFDQTLSPRSRALLDSPRRVSRTWQDSEDYQYRLSMP
ncbi:unnamed protein product [Symbiodinium pilosum]|uniref:Uncharacterized protein n=1 Tax=Symbiodinium pilosum TaxID=2952 RepID=A0A812N9C0_SYMPI|nr:unnamed protein product [Symbiodinium pilosum]